MNSVINLALNDAATNCRRDSAVATITLKSGVQLSGELEKPSEAFSTTAHIKFKDGGWATIDREEIVAVEVHPPPPRF